MGPRRYFKAPFYKDAPVSFASEIGYHGSPSVESIKKFISPEKLWPIRTTNGYCMARRRSLA